MEITHIEKFIGKNVKLVPCLEDLSRLASLRRAGTHISLGHYKTQIHTLLHSETESRMLHATNVADLCKYKMATNNSSVCARSYRQGN